MRDSQPPPGRNRYTDTSGALDIMPHLPSPWSLSPVGCHRLGCSRRRPSQAFGAPCWPRSTSCGKLPLRWANKRERVRRWCACVPSTRTRPRTRCFLAAAEGRPQGNSSRGKRAENHDGDQCRLKFAICQVFTFTNTSISGAFKRGSLRDCQVHLWGFRAFVRLSGAGERQRGRSIALRLVHNWTMTFIVNFRDL